MKLIALCGAAGAGKDTVADVLPARKLAFADALYREVARSYGFDSLDELKCRETKETPHTGLALMWMLDEGDAFIEHVAKKLGSVSLTDPRSPRQILQWWGDYRRAQDPDYFVNAVRCELWGRVDCADVITDVRFPNEAAMVRQLGGQIWQIKRPGYEAGGTGHASDTAGDEFAPDGVVYNHGDLEDLRTAVLQLWGMT